MQDVVNLIVNSGVAVGVIVYFLYRDYKFMASLHSTLTTLENTTESINKLLESIKEVKRNEDNRTF